MGDEPERPEAEVVDEESKRSDTSVRVEINRAAAFIVQARTLAKSTCTVDIEVECGCQGLDSTIIKTNVQIRLLSGDYRIWKADFGISCYLYDKISSACAYLHVFFLAIGSSYLM